MYSYPSTAPVVNIFPQSWFKVQYSRPLDSRVDLEMVNTVRTAKMTTGLRKVRRIYGCLRGSTDKK
jgi:hypothetical protein